MNDLRDNEIKEQINTLFTQELIEYGKADNAKVHQINGLLPLCDNGNRNEVQRA